VSIATYLKLLSDVAVGENVRINIRTFDENRTYLSVAQWGAYLTNAGDSEYLKMEGMLFLQMSIIYAPTSQRLIHQILWSSR